MRFVTATGAMSGELALYIGGGRGPLDGAVPYSSVRRVDDAWASPRCVDELPPPFLAAPHTLLSSYSACLDNVCMAFLSVLTVSSRCFAPKDGLQPSHCATGVGAAHGRRNKGGAPRPADSGMLHNIGARTEAADGLLWSLHITN